MAGADAAERSVMIIDSDRGFADGLADILRQRGCAALCLDAPERALAALREPINGDGSATVALIDARLPDGVDLIARLRAERPELICVLMAAALDGATVVAAMRGGADDFFDKSTGPNGLIEILDRAFNRTAARYQLRLAKDAAEAASRAKSGFLAMVSHELRTPLNAIIGFSEMMLCEELGPFTNTKYRDYVADIRESGMHLLDIINDILDLSKAEAGKLDLHEDVFQLRDRVRAVRQLIGMRIDKGGLTVSIDLPDDLPRLCADERKTTQVLLNLVDNAVKFTRAGGRIEIAGRFDPLTGITMTVSDTGIGIPPNDVRRVLRPFEQVESALRRERQGAGLGLPLVRAIMERHGGTVAVASEVGIGTHVSVTFPPQRAVAAPMDMASQSAA